MTRVEKYRATLRNTAEHLKEWTSATELSEATGISRQTAYAHLEALKALKDAYGIVLKRKTDRVHARGQKVVLYKITEGEVP